MTDRIRTWRQFSMTVRRRQPKLLNGLSPFNRPVLVTGCQRSGTTMLTTVILEHGGTIDYRQGPDSELDGALILSGRSPCDPSSGRYCFQTTYLNDNLHEYAEHSGSFKLIYVLRNPYSVVYSMCHHWKRRSQLVNTPLNGLFSNCGKELLTEKEMQRYKRFGPASIPGIRKACLCYMAKTSQVFQLAETIGSDMMVIDYDELVQHKKSLLPHVFGFADLEYRPRAADMINSRSLERKQGLNKARIEEIRSTCEGVYERALSLATAGLTNEGSLGVRRGRT